MTGPNVYDPSYYGGTGTAYQQQAALFNAERDKLVQQLLQQHGLLPTQQQPAPTQPMVKAATTPPADSWKDDELLGAAKFWGMPDAAVAAMPRDQLVGVLNDLQKKARPVDMSAAALPLTSRMGAEVGIGAALALTEGLHNLPIIGPALGRIEALHKANIYLHSLDTANRQMSPDIPAPFMTGAKWTGNLAAMAYPAEAAWAVAGRAGALVPFLSKASPIVRAAVQGAGSSALLMGGNEDFQNSPGSTLALGAGLGALVPAASALWKAMSPAIAGANTKVLGAFLRPDILPEGFTPNAPDIGPPTPLSGPPEGFAGGSTAPGAIATMPLTEAPLPKGFSTNEISENAAALNKTGIITGSPTLPEAAASTHIDETTVAKAAMESNPGGTSLVEAIADPAKFMQDMVDSPYAANVRFAKGKGGQQLDALISDQKITDAMVKEYEATGVYSGQQVSTRGGMQGTVESIVGNRAKVRFLNTDTIFEASTDALSPSVLSPGVREAPAMWESFKKYAQQKAIEDSAAMSGGQVVPEQLDTLLQQNRPQYLQDYLQKAGVTRKGDVARITSYFNRRYVEDYKALAPAESLASEKGIQDAQNAADGPNKVSPLGQLDEHAAAKGFVASPRADGGIDLIDTTVSASKTDPITVKMDGLESAADWLTKTNRELPDITPAADIPLETVGMHYQGAPQAPNMNGEAQARIPGAIAELATGEDAGLGELAARAAGNPSLGKLQNLYINGMTNLSSMRKLFASMDEFGSQAKLGDTFTPFKDYSNLSTAVNLQHNYEEPLQEAAHQVLSDIRVANRRSGLWSQMYLIEDPAARAATAAAKGLNPAEIAAFDKMPAFWNKLFGETGLAAEREIKGYLPMLQKMQSTGDFSAMQRWGGVSPESEAFFEFVRNGVVNSRELDPEVLMNTYIKTLSWNKHVASTFEDIATRWNGISKDVPELAPAANIVKNWLQVVRYGYQPGQDMMLDFAHGVAQKLIGPGVSRQQARQLVNYGLNASYSSLMGYRLDLAARDLQQIWLALPRAGGSLIKTMAKYLTGSNADRQALWAAAVDDNMVNLQHPRSLAPGATRPLEQAAYDPSELAAGTPSAREVALGKISATIEDMTPNAIKSDPRLRPGYIYGKQGEIVRMLVGQAAKSQALDALQTFRAAGAAGDMARLMTESKANTFFPAVGREFQRIVGTGNDNEAAAFLGRQLADASQFKYGIVNSPVMSRTVTGKLLSQLGTYPLYYTQYLGEALGGSAPIAAKVATAATIGTVSAAFYAASKATGWNFNKMNPFTGLTFTGGPVYELAQKGLTAASGLVNQATGQAGPDSPAPPSLGGVAGAAANLFNPAAGIMRTAGGIQQAVNSPYPGQALLRLGTTGETSIASDLNEQMMPQAQAQFMQSLQPIQSPMSVGRVGLPASQIPQQPVVNPPEIRGGQATAPLGDSTVALTAQRNHYDGAAQQLRQQRMPEEQIKRILGERP